MPSKKKSRVINHPHDHAFRAAMSDVRVAQDFLSHYLPASVLEKIDLRTLNPEKESYVDKTLSLSLTDILYSVKPKGNTDIQAYVYVLCEHFSTSRRIVPWRMFEYTYLIVKEKWADPEHDPLPIIIPLVVYNGARPYQHPTSLYDLAAEDQRELARAQMFHQFQLVDFTQVPDEEIRQHEFSQLMELLMKHARSRDLTNYLESLSGNVQYLIFEKAEQYIVCMLAYYAEMATDESENDRRFREFIKKTLPQTMEQQAMTLAQRWKYDARQEGRQEGRQETLMIGQLLRKGMSKKEISEKVGVGLKQIEEVEELLA